jgi:hypothetical protein
MVAAMVAPAMVGFSARDGGGWFTVDEMVVLWSMMVMKVVLYWCFDFYVVNFCYFGSQVLFFYCLPFFGCW